MDRKQEYDPKMKKQMYKYIGEQIPRHYRALVYSTLLWICLLQAGDWESLAVRFSRSLQVCVWTIYPNSIAEETRCLDSNKTGSKGVPPSSAFAAGAVLCWLTAHRMMPTHPGESPALWHPPAQVPSSIQLCLWPDLMGTRNRPLLHFVVENSNLYL